MCKARRDTLHRLALNAARLFPYYRGGKKKFRKPPPARTRSSLAFPFPAFSPTPRPPARFPCRNSTHALLPPAGVAEPTASLAHSSAFFFLTLPIQTDSTFSLFQCTFIYSHISCIHIWSHTQIIQSPNPAKIHRHTLRRQYRENTIPAAKFHVPPNYKKYFCNVLPATNRPICVFSNSLQYMH